VTILLSREFRNVQQNEENKLYSVFRPLSRKSGTFGHEEVQCGLSFPLHEGPNCAHEGEVSGTLKGQCHKKEKHPQRAVSQEFTV
jgi:hypothetical protein